MNWTGATCCTSGNYCQYENPYYSACRPVVSGATTYSGQCPPPTGQDAQMRAAASVAFDLMNLSAQGQVGQANAYWVYSVLASQRYRVSSNATIEFDPDDPLFSHVTNTMKAKLAIAQLDSSVAQLLVAGLNSAHATTDGWIYPSVPAAQGLDGYKYPGPTHNQLLDHSAGDSVVITGKPWCQTQAVTFAETCMNSHNYAPLIMHDIRDWRSAPPTSYTGPAHLPATPFSGSASAGNPYLIVSVNGQVSTWEAYSFAGADCYALPNSTCTGTLLVDPIPYTQPAAYYDSTGATVGPQSNPFALVATDLYADPSHAGQWATRTINGVQQWGTFSTPINVLGITVYAYAKKM